MKKAILLGLAIIGTLSFVGCASRYDSTTDYPYDGYYGGYNDGYYGNDGVDNYNYNGGLYNDGPAGSTTTGVNGNYYNNGTMYR